MNKLFGMADLIINRLIIIGNGFDLAHGLRTKYTDFIEDYFSQIKDSSYEDDFISFEKPGYLFTDCRNMNDILEYVYSTKDFSGRVISDANLISPTARHMKFIDYKNKFFETICISHQMNINWVDIEMEYYKSLRALVNNHESNDVALKREVLALNEDFAGLKKRFNAYLLDKVCPLVRTQIFKEMDELLAPVRIFTNTDLEGFSKEFSGKKQKVIVEALTRAVNEREKGVPAFTLGETFALNFNYTTTIDNYHSHSGDWQKVYIHGQCDNIHNPINFGFGDEMDGYYSVIENKNENQYLRFMKSFMYSNNDSYNKLLNFIEEAPFQVHIMGHSCGLSDRTLLNTIFEHENCWSIKPFFFESKDKTDNNYTDMVQNISRHFNKKPVMREKIVNKQACVRLPQFDD